MQMLPSITIAIPATITIIAQGPWLISTLDFLRPPVTDRVAALQLDFLSLLIVSFSLA